MMVAASASEVLWTGLDVGAIWLLIALAVIGIALVGSALPEIYWPAVSTGFLGAAAVGFTALLMGRNSALAVAILAIIATTTMVSLCRNGPRHQAFYNRLTDDETPVTQPAIPN